MCLFIFFDVQLRSEKFSHPAKFSVRQHWAHVRHTVVFAENCDLAHEPNTMFPDIGKNWIWTQQGGTFFWSQLYLPAYRYFIIRQYICENLNFNSNDHDHSVQISLFVLLPLTQIVVRSMPLVNIFLICTFNYTHGMKNKN